MTEDGGRPEGRRPSRTHGTRAARGDRDPRGPAARPLRSARSNPQRSLATPLLAAAFALSSFTAGCAATATPFPVEHVAEPEAATRPPADGPRMRIVDLEEYASEAPGWVVVVGTLENGGRSTTEELRITVNALGPGDRVVTSSPAIARSQSVPPRGHTSFAAVFAKLAEVEAYHVKVLAW